MHTHTTCIMHSRTLLEIHVMIPNLICEVNYYENKHLYVDGTHLNTLIMQYTVSITTVSVTYKVH